MIGKDQAAPVKVKKQLKNICMNWNPKTFVDIIISLTVSGLGC